MAIKGLVWDTYWRELEEISVDKIIRRDSYYRVLKRLLKLPPKWQEVKILEVGSGSGMRTIALQKDFKDQKFQASLVDLSLNALLFARKYSAGTEISTNLILSDGCRLPFFDETFDIVWNEGVNEHFDGKARYGIFREMSRVCKANGQVIVIVPNAFNLPYRITKKVLEMKSRWAYGFEKPFTVFELKEKMKRAGMTGIKAGGAGVVGSFLAFAQLIPTQMSKISKKEKRKYDNHVFLKQVFVLIESTLETLFGPLFAKDISVTGFK